MTDSFEFTVPGKPITRQRQAYIVNGHATVTVDAKSRRYERDVRVFAQLEMASSGRALFSQALEIWVAAYLPVPRSWSKKKKDAALAGTVFPTSKPDGDNLTKAAVDACKGIVWTDDSIIVDWHISKRYSATPRMTLTVCPARLPLEVVAESEAA